ncbi:MAM and LDL-receptor class A domain-containing 2-like [Paramuricea clavata]|uniref:MAM and LDL-receptor class A domain-containing 2-like n=1 Tax=Paramuricea clavata TaxID=317549 RepID=A0A7D9HZN4_PARCT|nr:MAM and LDL-receptor class A domain-containing 2-like [Paramuricea clavata]
MACLKAEAKEKYLQYVLDEYWRFLPWKYLITKKIFRISSIIPCLLCIAISFAQKIDKFSCDFEDNICQWTQDKTDDYDWSRNQASTRKGTGPLTDHTKGPLTNKKQGPGSIRHSSSKCIHVVEGADIRPKEGYFLVIYTGCGEDRMEFRLWPNGMLMLTKYGMCVKPTGPETDGVKVGVFNSCNATDTWSWTAKGSLQYKKKMCLKPETGGEHPRNHADLVLDSICDERQNFFEFVPSDTASGWYLFINRWQPNKKARLISPSTTKAKSCLLFFYHMFGYNTKELRVYVKSGGKMYSVWSLSGEQGVEWHQAQVAVNNQTTSYQFVIEAVRGGYYGDIAIDDISLMVSCPPRGNQTRKPTVDNKDKGTTDDSNRIIIIATTVGAGVFLSIVLIVLLMKYKRRNRASKLSTPVFNIPLETNEISPEPLPVDEDPCYETIGKFYDDFGTSGSESEDPSADGGTSLYDRVGVPSNADKTSEYETPVENEHQRPGRTSDHDEVEVPSNAHQASGHTELNKRPDTLKRGATGDGDHQAFLKKVDIIEIYVIQVPEEAQHETGQNETYEEPKLSPENPVYTELDVKGRNTTENGTYQNLVKQDLDYVTPAPERRESYV